MHLPFRDYHLLQFLESWQKSSFWGSKKSRYPLDRALYLYFRENRSLGSKDREEIAKNVYQLVRWSVALDAIAKDREKSWKSRWETFQKGRLQEKERLSDHESVSFPKPLFDLFVQSYGKKKALELCEILQLQAPVFLRVNTLKIDRSELLKILPSSWQAQEGELAETVKLQTRSNLFQSEAFKKGYFEMQDEGSQKLAALVKASAGDLVLDYCAGSGGKALAIAPRMQNKGQLFLHDVRKHALAEAKLRLKRAGIENAQIMAEGHPGLKKLKKKCQWVLVDAPCSGTGTLRRSPDMKERIDETFVQELVSMQRCIFEKALSYVAPGGHIIYATCSLLKQENEQQVEHFLKTYPIKRAACDYKLPVIASGHDGFFAAHFLKN